MANNEPIMICGYQPGLIGRCTTLHAKYYSENWDFGHYFETKVATGISEFINRYDVERDCFWSISLNGNIEATLAIDRSGEQGNIGHLRWFIVSDVLRGSGAGNQLLSHAIEFCREKKYDRIYLWTFAGLRAARHLYEKFGFRLADEFSGHQWGVVVAEQKFELEL